MSINQVLLMGNVGADPVIRSTNEGKKIASFSIATSEKWLDKKTKEKREKTDWNKVVIFSDGLSGVVEKYVKKGTRICVQGKMVTRKWTDDSGIERYVTEVVLDGFNSKLEIIMPPKNNDVSENFEDDIADSLSNIEDDIPF
jgi:single-strand DNA-binding protein